MAADSPSRSVSYRASPTRRLMEYRRPPDAVLDIGQGRTDTVVVYLDRAEVCRSMRVHVRAGENEVVVKNLSACVDKDSIRVESNGDCRILEVSYQERPIHGSPGGLTYGGDQQRLREQLDTARYRHSALVAKQQRLLKQRQVLDGWADGLGRAENTEAARSVMMMDQSILHGMSGFLELYERQASRLDDSLQQVSQELDRFQKQIESTEQKLETSKDSGAGTYRELGILVSSEKEMDTELFVSYVVTKARWMPKYDIRVYSPEKTMKILYHGLVQQNTGEDWDNTKLCLSTALPSIGASMPDLGTLTISFKHRPQEPDNQIRRGRFGSRRRKGEFQHAASVERVNELSASQQDLMSASVGSEDSFVMETTASTTHAATSGGGGQQSGSPGLNKTSSIHTLVPAQPEDSITNTMYEIARRSSIPSDDCAHKVSVAIVDLEPSFEYECVPKLASHVYLKAKVTNNSPYALLPGPASIFLDNNFIAKTEIKAVSPSEEFTCCLGIDPALRVLYKPLVKRHDQSGLLTKSRVTTYEQRMEIRNTHLEAVKILVIDQLPLSLEEKIKVSLQEPAIKHADRYDRTRTFRLNQQNNIEWEVMVAPGDAREIAMRYTVEFPATEELDFCITRLPPQAAGSDSLILSRK